MIGLITVNYNQYQMTYEFLDSLAKCKGLENIQVYIADVSTNKEKFDFKKYPFKVISYPLQNKGYAYGINMGIKYFLNQGLSKFCAINNDIIFDKEFIKNAVKGFEKADIFGGKIYYAPGYEYHKKYEKKDLGKVFWYAGGITNWRHSTTTHRGVDEIDKYQFDKFEKTDFVTGCMLFFNKKVVDRVGLWDESYFLYYEDADFCERAKKAGFDLFYNPSIVIWHKNAQSTGGSGSSLHAKYQKKNHLRFGLKYAPLRTKLHLIKNYFLK